MAGIFVVAIDLNVVRARFTGYSLLEQGWPLKDSMILNKNNFYKHVFFQFFIILFGNIINEFFSVFSCLQIQILFQTL